MKIGELAERVGVSVHTLRYYDQIGLLNPQSREPNNYREYGDRALLTVELIQRCKRLGFTLDEIRSRLGDMVAGKTNFGDLSEAIEAKIQATEANITRLRIVQKDLRGILERCPSQATIRSCLAPLPD